MSETGIANDAKIILLKDVTFGYAAQPVLADVNLALESGGFFSIIGPNGGGKTTLLKLILGLLKPQKGTIQVFGRSPLKARKLTGYVAQYMSFDEFFPVTALEVVLMGRLGKSVLGRYTPLDRKKAAESLAEVGLLKLDNMPFSELSGGQRQRVLIARALVTEPRLLLLDEPTANIDAAVEKKFAALLEELAKRMTVIMVTHDVGFVTHLVKHVVCVNKSVVLHPTHELTGRVITDMYGSDTRIIRHEKICPERDG